MTSAEFKTCYQMAVTGNYSLENLNQCDGFGLPDFQKRIVAAVDFAGLIVWQCVQLNGGIDAEALQVLYSVKNKFVLA